LSAEVRGVFTFLILDNSPWLRYLYQLSTLFCLFFDTQGALTNYPRFSNPKTHKFLYGADQDQPQINRDAQNELLDQVRQSSKSIIGIIGESGTGKSTLLRQLGNKINSGEGVAIWFPAEEINLNKPVRTKNPIYL